MRADSPSTSAATVWPSTSVASSASTSAGFVCSDDVEQALGELDEVGVLGDEVGLAVELEQRAVLADDDAVGRGALEALADVLGALDAQELDGLVVVAVGLGQGLLAVHHAGAGGVAETLDVGCGELSHVTSSGSVVVRERGGRAAAPSPTVRAAGAAPVRSGVLGALGAGARSPVAGTPSAGATSAAVTVGGSAGVSASAAGAAASAAGAAGGVATGQELALPVGQRLVATDDRLGAVLARPALACAAERAMRPSATASAITRVSTAMLRIASSLPGIL